MRLPKSPNGDYSIHMGNNSTEEIIRAVNTNILVEITRSGSSKNAIAQKAGIPASTFTRKVTGKGSFSIKELGDIADALDLNFHNLLRVNISKDEAI